MGMEQVFARDPNFVSRRIEAETILVPIRNNVGDLDCIFSLNPVGALVWEQLDGVATWGSFATASSASTTFPKPRPRPT